MTCSAVLRISALTVLAIGTLTCGSACQDAGNPTVVTDPPGATENANGTGPSVPGNVVPGMGGAAGGGSSGGAAGAGTYR